MNKIVCQKIHLANTKTFFAYFLSPHNGEWGEGGEGKNSDMQENVLTPLKSGPVVMRLYQICIEILQSKRSIAVYQAPS